MIDSMSGCINSTVFISGNVDEDAIFQEEQMMRAAVPFLHWENDSRPRRSQIAPSESQFENDGRTKYINLNRVHKSMKCPYNILDTSSIDSISTIER